MDLSIIIPSYNTKELLKNCINSILDQKIKKISFEIIVVDNNSSDGSVEEIQNSKLKTQNQNLKLKIIQNKDNVGFSKANNQGIKIAEGRYILFLNSDTIVAENVLETMVKFMDENTKVGASTCKINLPTGEMDDACHRGFPTPWNALSHFSGLSKIMPKTKLFSGYSLSYMDLSKTHEIDAACGAFMIVRREAGEQIGWWDEDYFWYGEDLDFCFKLKEKGWKIFFVPEVSILHFKGASGGIKEISKHLTKADEKTRKLASAARFEAMRIFYKKHYQNKYPFFINWVTLQGISFKRIIS